jgi:Leucine-rich repeat (LRR) protein
LTTLKQLQHLDISKNQIKLTSDLHELRENESLIGIDVSGNQITDEENVVDFFASIPTLISIQSKDNPFAR